MQGVGAHVDSVAAVVFVDVVRGRPVFLATCLSFASALRIRFHDLIPEHFSKFNVQ